jgi:hypothetical protein
VGQVGLVRGRFVIAGRGVRRREDESPRPGEPRGVEQPEGLGDIDLERPQRIADRVRNPGPCREVDDRVDTGNRLNDGATIGEGRLDEIERNAAKVGQPSDRKVVENSDPIAAFDEQADERRADEAGAAGNEDGSVQRGCIRADEPTPARGSGAQRTFWTNVPGSIRSRAAAIRLSIVSISSSLRRRGSRPSSMSFEWRAL